MALQLHQIIDGFLKKWNVEWARNFVTVIILRQTKFPRFLVKLCTVRRIFIELWGTTYKD